MRHFESVCVHTVEKFLKKDTKKSHFSNRMELRKRSNGDLMRAQLENYFKSPWKAYATSTALTGLAAFLVYQYLAAEPGATAAALGFGALTTEVLALSIIAAKLNVYNPKIKAPQASEDPEADQYSIRPSKFHFDTKTTVAEALAKAELHNFIVCCFNGIDSGKQKDWRTAIKTGKAKLLSAWNKELTLGDIVKQGWKPYACADYGFSSS